MSGRITEHEQATRPLQPDKSLGELFSQLTSDLGGTVEMGEMAVREEARGLLLPTAIFARWSKS